MIKPKEIVFYDNYFRFSEECTSAIDVSDPENERIHGVERIGPWGEFETHDKVYMPSKIKVDDATWNDLTYGSSFGG